MINSNSCKHQILNKSNRTSKYFNTLCTKLRAMITHTPYLTPTNHEPYLSQLAYEATIPYLFPYIYSNNFNFNNIFITNQFIKLNNTIYNKITALKIVKLTHALYFNLKTSKQNHTQYRAKIIKIPEKIYQ